MMYVQRPQPLEEGQTISRLQQPTRKIIPTEYASQGKK